MKVESWIELKSGMFVELSCGCKGKIETVNEHFFILRKWHLHGIEDQEFVEPMDEKFMLKPSGYIWFPMKLVPEQVSLWFRKREQEHWSVKP